MCRIGHIKISCILTLVPDELLPVFYEAFLKAEFLAKHLLLSLQVLLPSEFLKTFSILSHHLLPPHLQTIIDITNFTSHEQQLLRVSTPLEHDGCW